MNNGRRHPHETKQKARELRGKGYTHREIAKKLSISRGSAHLWTIGVILTSRQKRALQIRQARATKARFTPELRKRFSEAARINLSKYWKKKSTKEDMLKKIKDFHATHGRIPLKREFNLYEEYKNRFGSWNNAVRLAGFEPNKVIFSKKFVAKDGHVCDSFAERIIDDWLFSLGIFHKRNVPYENTKMTADFGISNVRVEYFGLTGEVKGYDEAIKKKKKFCREKRLHLVEVYPQNLFSKNFRQCLGEILKEIKSHLS